jgi:intein/homing endonuclease
MSDGTKMNIQDVKVGMEVLSYNEETKNQEFSKVESIITSSTFELVKISTKSGIEILCTKEHPFWVVDSATGWIQAIILDKGDILLLENCVPDEIVSIKSNRVKETTIYNLRISNNKTYYANGILVHNKDLIFDQIYYGQQAVDIVKQLQELYRQDYTQDYQYATD